MVLSNNKFIKKKRTISTLIMINLHFKKNLKVIFENQKK
jgi:hypothetical protein